MTLKSKEVKSTGGGNRVEQPSLPAGGYPARVVWVIDLGVQSRLPYKGEEKDPIEMFLPVYELSDEFMVDEDGNEVLDKPRWIFDRAMPLYNLDADRALSTQRYMAIDPEITFDGDWSKLVGQPVTVNIVNNKVKDKVYDNVGSLSAMRTKEANKLPELVNDSLFLSVDDTDVETFKKIPKWIQEKIEEGIKWETTALYKALNGDVKEEKPVEKEEPEDDGSDEDEDDGEW